MEFVDVEALTVEELREYRAALRERIAELDEQEPADMESEEYEEWGEQHEELEDLVDEVLDRLEDLT